MGTKILVVDDEVDLEYMLVQRFRHKIATNTYQFRFASSGNDALLLIQKEPDFDVLLLDINMPGMDGLTLMSKIYERLPDSRAVIVSAYGDMDNIRSAMNRGAFDFLCKPINFRDLEATIEKTAEQVRQLRDSAQVKQLAELKARFFDNITHEFRTPLSLILAPIERLLQDPTNVPALHPNRDLVTIDYNARYLLRLINQLLDLSRLEAGHLPLAPRPGNLGQLIAQIVDAFIPLAQQKGLNITYRNNLPGSWLFDAQKIGQIAYNLIANAIKFTDPSEERDDHLLVKLRYESGVELVVADTGIGIAPTALPHIFDRFYQDNPLSYHSLSGTGIGLSVVKEFSELMGGRVSVQSNKDPLQGPCGTQFTITLPLANDSSGESIQDKEQSFWDWFPQYRIQPSAEATPAVATTAETPLVLVVEDNDELRTYLIDELSSRYRVLTASTGEEGWHLAQTELPDLVISDVMMPLMDGYALTDRIKSTPVTEHLAVILLTAKAAYDNLLDGLRQGADDYITKPFRIEELRLRVHNLILHQQRLRNFYGQQLTNTDLPLPIETVQDSWLRTLYKLLDKHLDDPLLTVDWLAGQLAMSRKTLLRKVKALTQLSPNELIRQYRLRKAADLLLAGHNVSETAYLVGFESPTYFGQCFKEQYKLTPSEFANA